MICRIADLIVDIPATGGMSPRCREYELTENRCPEIRIIAEEYRLDAWPGLLPELVPYMESGVQFYTHLLYFSGLMLHASAVAIDGRAYVFSGPCGAGKSTHTRLWQQTFGEAAQVFNDDKPALRRVDDRWYAYGTPWCGKDGINLNQKWPLGGICFLVQGEENRIRRLTSVEAVGRLMGQTIYKLYPKEMELLLKHMDTLVQEIPIFELENRPEEAAAQLSYETMRRVAEEAGL